MKKTFASLVAISVSFVGSAFAETNSIATTITAMQSDMTTNLTLVGTALVALAAVAVGFKWIKAMIFG